MLIEEVVRSCTNDRLAEAAVASIGRRFFSDVSDRASAYGMSVGAFTVLSVNRFVRHGDEAELRSVVSAMKKSQEPVLAGLHRILCTMLASDGISDAPRRPTRMPRMTAQLCTIETDARREMHV